jgi:hypothetical protein
MDWGLPAMRRPALNERNRLTLEAFIRLVSLSCWPHGVAWYKIKSPQGPTDAIANSSATPTWRDH